MSESDDYIKNERLLNGVFASLHNAEKFLKTANELSAKKDFQTSIPIATISIEESLKGVELATKFRRGENMSKEDYEKLTDHKHKLVHVKEDAIDVMKNLTDEEEKNSRQELESYGIKVPPVEKSKLIDVLKKRSQDHSQFKNLRENCLFTGWDAIQKKWMIFDELYPETQEDLAFYITHEAESEINFLRFTIERIVNNLRESGQLKEKPPYPSYAEFRTADKYESLKELYKEGSKLDKIKLQKGYKAFQKFVAMNSFQYVTLSVFSDTMLKYLRLLAKQKSEEWYAHPMLKSIMMALTGASNENKDGNYSGISGDADLTPNKKPCLSFMTIVNRKSEIFKIEKVLDLRFKDREIPSEMIEKILRTDIVIERKEGKEIPLSNFIEAASVVGVTMKKLKDNEIESAIEYAKELLSQGRFQPPTEDIRKEILSATKDNWKSLKPETRQTIAPMYGSKIYKGNTVMLTEVPDNVEKWKCRENIMNIIQSEFFPSA